MCIYLLTTTRKKGARGPREDEAEARRAKKRRFEDWQRDHCGIDLRTNIPHLPRCIHWFDITAVDSDEVKSEGKTETKTEETEPPSTTGGCSGKADQTDDAFQ